MYYAQGEVRYESELRTIKQSFLNACNDEFFFQVFM